MRKLEYSDEDLIDLVISGDHNAYRKIVDKYKNYVFSAVYKIISHSEDAEDVAQETFVKAFRALESFDGRSKFSTWLYKIAINTAISHRRKKKFYTQDIEEVQINDTVSIGGSMKQQEQKEYLQKAFQLLGEDDVTMLTLFYLKELSLEEIAEITDFEANNVKVKLYRARKRLAEKMKLILKSEAKSLL